MNTYQAYQILCERLTEEEKIQLNMKENNINRKLTPWEITKVFKLGPTEEKTIKKRRLADEVENSSWMNE